MMRRIPVVLGMATLVFALIAQAADLPSAKIDDKQSASGLQEEARYRQERLAQRFKDFEAQLLLVAQRLEASGKQEDKEKAQVLRSAIKLASESGVDVRFLQVVELLKNSKQATSREVQTAIDLSEELSKNIRELLNLLLTDSRDKARRDEIERIQNLLKELNRIIRDQKIVRAQTERGQADPKSQGEVTEATKKLSGQETGKPGDGNKGKQGIGEARGGKKGAGHGEAKEDTNKPKGEGHGKDGNKAGEGKSGEGKSGEGKAGEGKSGEGKSGEGKAGEGKAGEGKAGEGKAGEGKSGEGKSGEGKSGEGKSGEGKAGEGKSGEGKPGEGKAGEGKAGEPKAGEPKAGEGKSGEGKAGQPGSGQGKGKGQGKGEGKGGQGEGKGGQGEGKGGQGQGKGGQGQAKGGGQGQGSQGSQGSQGGSKGGQQAKSGLQPPPAPAKKAIDEAIPHQQKAEKDLEKKDNADATDNQNQAIDKLEEARRRLEEILKQLREEEILKTLADLQRRCEYMLAMQKEVYEGTTRLDKAIGENADKKATRTDEQNSQKLADREGLIVKEASFAETLVKSEGSAVAFADAFTQLVEDTRFIQKNLNKTDVGQFTQKTELDVIQLLEWMIDALKKAQQQAKSGQSGQGQAGKPGAKPLVDLLAELKLIRFRQLMVNKQTEDAGQRYPGEQTNDAVIKDRLKQLSDRQDRLKGNLHDIVTGKNK